ncbi:MAG: YfhO family protein [Lachnospiraceae bacterium]|nr:YfhO family protein [Lachnospiraceae bacterium]
MEEKRGIKRIGTWWNSIYIYVISSLLIIAVLTVVLIVKHFWPFGNSVMMYGDYITQSWKFLAEFKSKLASGESLFYTWHAGFGTNFFSLLSFGIINPFLFIYLLIPTSKILQVGTIVYMLTLVSMNCSMLYYLTHRPKNKLQKNKLANILFSMSYALCIYVVSNVNIWYFLTCAIFFPLILLGLENYVAGKGWKLYFVTLALAFLCNYYFAGLFCLFIVLYYLTLEFDSFKAFVKKSAGIFLISFMAVLSSGIILIPTAVQMMGQDYTTSAYNSSVTFFTTFFDIIKNFFIFNNYIETGSTLESYGEVSLYYGLLPLMLTTFYFLNPKFKISTRIRKLIVVALYLLAFNTNVLNYIMHLFHYPVGYPNRFSLFFILFCIILAYEAWSSMEEAQFENMSILKGCFVGIGWTIITLCTFAFAEVIKYQFTYYFSIMIFMFYMVGMIMLPLLKGKEARILAIIGCVELCLNFSYITIFRNASLTLDGVAQREAETEEFFDDMEFEEVNGFSRVLGLNDTVSNLNSGMLFDYNGVTVFASSIGNIGEFLDSMGIYAAKNNIRSTEFTEPTMSLLNIQYIFVDQHIAFSRSMIDDVFTGVINPYGRYPVVTENDGFILYENPSVLSIGYRIDEESKEIFEEDFGTYSDLGYDRCALINKWIEGISDGTNVFEKMSIQASEVNAYNCMAAVMGDNVLIARDMTVCENQGFDLEQEGVLISIPDTEWNKNESSYVEIKYVAPEDGEYFCQYGCILMATGYLEKGETFSIYRSLKEDAFESEESAYEACNMMVYRYNENQWRKAYQELSEQQLQVTNYSSSEIQGTVDFTEDGILFTSIPYDKSWHVYVDGEEAEILPLWQESFVSVELPKGEHVVEFRYKQRGFALGIILTCIGITFFILGIVNEKRKRRIEDKGNIDEKESVLE